MFNHNVEIYKRFFNKTTREWELGGSTSYDCHVEGVSSNKLDNPHYQPDKLFAIVIPRIGLGVNPKDVVSFRGKKYEVVTVKEGDWGVDSSLNNTTLTIK